MSLYMSLLCGLTQCKCKHECMIVLVQVVVQGIPFAYAWQDLKDLFKPVGGVKADIVMGQDGRSKGWGTVLFDSLEDAEKAIQVHRLIECMQLQACVEEASPFVVSLFQCLSCSLPARLNPCSFIAARIREMLHVQQRPTASRLCISPKI